MLLKGYLSAKIQFFQTPFFFVEVSALSDELLKSGVIDTDTTLHAVSLLVMTVY